MKIKYFVAGMISLIVFGLLLPQPIQALFVYTSLKSFFDSHLVLLCILVGAVQGVSEECGYYIIMKKIYKKDKKEILPLGFGLGRGVLLPKLINSLLQFIQFLLVNTACRVYSVCNLIDIICHAHNRLPYFFHLIVVKFKVDSVHYLLSKICTHRGHSRQLKAFFKYLCFRFCQPDDITLINFFCFHSAVILLIVGLFSRTVRCFLSGS